LVDVLLFAIARYMVVYHERTIDLLIGVIAIAGLIAVKKYLLGSDLFKGWNNSNNPNE
jgi:phosphate starvation-inducible membrane PsiE